MKRVKKTKTEFSVVLNILNMTRKMNSLNWADSRRTDLKIDDYIIIFNIDINNIYPYNDRNDNDNEMMCKSEEMGEKMIFEWTKKK